MKLQKIYVRYFPPGLAFNYVRSGSGEETRCVDVFELTATADVESVLKELRKREPRVVSRDVLPQVRELLAKMQKKLSEPAKNKFYLYKTLQTHILPLTNVDFDRSGERCATGSYDRTCRVWNVETGDEVHVLKGHENVVFSVAFNYPRCDRLVTGSFDRTAKVWSASSGACLSTLWGHGGEVVAAEFSRAGDRIATASMDGTAVVWSAETAQEIGGFRRHTAEVISCRFNGAAGTLLATGSFDDTAMVWDVRTHQPTHVLRGHDAELSNCRWSAAYDRVATSSLDGTAKVWELRHARAPLFTLPHRDDVLDVCFDYTGKVATCSSDGTAKVWNAAADGRLALTLDGHRDEISRVVFSPNGSLLLTASADKTARLWHVSDNGGGSGAAENGACLQVLSGHEGELFSCAFNYAGDAILTASKDNTCKLYR